MAPRRETTTPKFMKLCDIQPTTTQTKIIIKVRVIHLVIGSEYNNPDTDQIEMIFTDEEGVKIQATMKNGVIDHKKKVFYEGRDYVISKPGIAKNMSNLTNHSSRLYINLGTVVESCIPPLKIAPTSISYMSFTDILQEKCDDVLPFDILGELILFTPVMTSSKEKRKYMKVVLADGSDINLSGILWGNYAVEMKAQVDVWEKAENKNKIFVCCMYVRRKVWTEMGKQEMTFQTTAGTRIMFNPENDDVRALIRSRASGVTLSQLPARSTITVEEEYLNIARIRSIKQLKDSTETGIFVVYGTICDVESEKWAYKSCNKNKCIGNVEDKLQDSGLKDKCGLCQTEVIKGEHSWRFQVRCKIEDDEDETMVVILEDRVRPIINKTASEIFFIVNAGYLKIQMTDKELQDYALVEIEKRLRKNASTLRSFPNITFPDEMAVAEGENRLIVDELCYDIPGLEEEHRTLLGSLTVEQRLIYDEIMSAISSGEGGVFFIYGYGGTGKTFIWKTLCAAIRSKREIVLPVASSGIASLLLPRGRTAHSRFSIPINVDENTTCNRIKPDTHLTQLLQRTKLIIWDKAPMAHRFCFETLDRSMRDVLKSMDKPFGGKVVVFGGDFRQILPVVPYGSRQDIVSATINSSYLWRNCKVRKLTKNMRLTIGCDAANVEEMREFSEWLLKLGDGKLGEDNHGEVDIRIPDEFLLNYSGDPLEAIVKNTYPSLEDNLWRPEYFQQRAILAPTHDVVSTINNYMLNLLPGEEREYLRSDSISKEDDNLKAHEDIFSTEFLNTIKCSGLPSHSIRLKVGAPVMLLRNIDQSDGLCNGTRLVVTNLGNHVIEASVLTGGTEGEKVFIPRMTLTPSDKVRFPVKVQRRQFPLAVCFAMTINKSQGQSLSHVGLYLPKPVFSHGQLYVAISRVTSRKGIKILICDHEDQPSTTTTNVVYKEVFQKL